MERNQIDNKINHLDLQYFRQVVRGVIIIQPYKELILFWHDFFSLYHRKFGKTIWLQYAEFSF